MHNIYENLENWREFPFVINHYDQSAVFVVISQRKDVLPCETQVPEEDAVGFFKKI